MQVEAMADLSTPAIEEESRSDLTEGRLIMMARDHTRNYTTLTDATHRIA